MALSLKIAVKLLTKNFKNGVAGLAASLRGLQMQFLALSGAMTGGTIALTNLLQRMRDVSKETTSARITLKNVSKSTKEFADAQKWLLQVSKQYGVGINTLTLGFAKFKSAADNAGMSLADQKNIFESVSRAAVAYGLSAENQKGVFIALQQMMAKGKVMAEELRLQMAERMPVALQAMADAAGTTTSGLDALMQTGKVLSADVLPKFAENLNRLIPNLDVDNLNKSLIDLSNNFVELVKKFDIEAKFKSIVEFFSRILGALTRNAEVAAGIIKRVFLALGLFAAKGVYRAFVQEGENTSRAAQKLLKDQEKANKAYLAAKERLETRSLQFEEAQNKERALSAEATENQKLRAAQRVAAAKRELEKAQTAVEYTENRKREADALVTGNVIALAGMSSASVWKKAWLGVTVTMKRVGASIKSIMASNIITAALMVVFELGNALVKAYKETKRIRDLVKDTLAEINQPVELSKQEQEFTAAFNIVKNHNKYDDETRLSALAKINSLLGTQYNLYDDLSKKRDEINAKAARYISYLRTQQKLERAQSVVTAKTAEFDAWKAKNPGWESQRGAVVKDTYHPETGQLIKGSGLNNIARDLQKFENAISLATNAAEEATAELAALEKEFNNQSSISVSNNVTTTDDSKSKETALDKAREKYRESLAELAAEYHNGLITEKEFNRRKKDLVESTFTSAIGSGDEGILGSDFFKEIEQAFGSFAHGELRDREEQLVDMIDEYNESLAEQKRLLDNGAISQEQYKSALRELSQKIYSELSGFNLAGLSAEMIATALGVRTGAMITNASSASAYQPRRKRNQSFVGRTTADMLEEQKRDAEHYLDWLRSQQEEIIGGLADEINKQMEKVESLDQALRLEQTAEDIKRLRRDIGRNMYDGLKGTISSIDGIVGAFENLRRVMDDPDASGWEKFMAIFTSLTSVTDSVLGVIDLVRTLTQTTEMLSAAQQANAAISTAATATQLENSASVISAKTAEAGAFAAADQAKIPFGWFAIPAVIAGVMAMFSALPKFAKGGVVGGNSRSGDKVLARLNSGEGVLTDTGMEGLAEAARPRQTDVRISGTLTAKGRDLQLVLDRQNRFDQRIK